MTGSNEHFGDPNKEETAQRKLREIKQGNRQLEDFITDFQTYQTQTGIDEKALIETFKQSMNRSLLETIYGHEHIPTTLKGWQDRCISADRRRRELHAFEGRTFPSQRPYTRSNWNVLTPVQTPPPQQDPNAMDVD